jgi:hypothetical protein
MSSLKLWSKATAKLLLRSYRTLNLLRVTATAIKKTM